jgi:hypothetical protein
MHTSIVRKCAIDFSSYDLGILVAVGPREVAPIAAASSLRGQGWKRCNSDPLRRYWLGERREHYYASERRPVLIGHHCEWAPKNDRFLYEIGTES